MLVPAMQSIGTCSSSSAFSTPTCAPPFAPPPARTSPTCGRAVAAAAKRIVVRTPHAPMELPWRGGRASKCGYLLAGTVRKRRVFVHSRNDLGTLLARAAARPVGEILRDLCTAFMLDGRGVVRVDLDDRAGAREERTRCQQTGETYHR